MLERGTLSQGTNISGTQAQLHSGKALTCPLMSSSAQRDRTDQWLGLDPDWVHLFPSRCDPRVYLSFISNDLVNPSQFGHQD